MVIRLLFEWQSDIRKWFVKQHDKNNGNAPKPAKPAAAVKLSPVTSQQENVVKILP